LLAGEDEARGEREMLARDPAGLRAEALLVPHHGSKTSSTDAFIGAVAPSVGLLSVGYRNRFHHPHGTVTARYAEHGVRLRRTDQEGALRIALPADASGEIAVEGHASRVRYWSERRPSP
jgi:competence protein ComEC